MSSTRRTLLETRRFKVIEETVTRPNGDVASVQFIAHPGSVAVLPLVGDDQVCLIHSRRLTVGKTLIEIPAGTREPNEEPLATAHRELTEETGYRAVRMEQLAITFASPGIINERMWIYAAQDLTPGNHAREANEEIENYVVQWDEAIAMVERGEIEDSKTIIALLTWDRRRK